MKRLACWLGRHDWTTRVERGESYKVCAVCGKTPPDLSETWAERDEEPTWQKRIGTGGGPGDGS